MRRKYVFEKGVDMPLCCLENGHYFNPFTGEKIIRAGALDVLGAGLKNKAFKIKEIDLSIYKIISLNYETGDYLFRAYVYILNDCCNYLDAQKNLLTPNEAKYIKNKLMAGEYEALKIWE